MFPVYGHGARVEEVSTGVARHPVPLGWQITKNPAACEGLPPCSRAVPFLEFILPPAPDYGGDYMQ
jgi:hypothetical protein